MASPLISRPLLFGPRHQVRHATLLRRPKKPYTFTQMITLSDGSTFLHRTTSPQPIYRTTRDTKNNVLWNPSSQKLLNIEEDEAGRLKRFRKRFGRGFDAEGAAADATSEGVDKDEQSAQGQAQEEDSLMDLISGFGEHGQSEPTTTQPAASKQPAKKSGKGKGGQK